MPAWKETGRSQSVTGKRGSHGPISAVRKKMPHDGSLVPVHTSSDLPRCEGSSEERRSIVLMDRKGEADPKWRTPQDYSQSMNMGIRSLSYL